MVQKSGDPDFRTINSILGFVGGQSFSSRTRTHRIVLGGEGVILEHLGVYHKHHTWSFLAGWSITFITMVIALVPEGSGNHGTPDPNGRCSWLYKWGVIRSPLASTGMILQVPPYEDYLPHSYPLQIDGWKLWSFLLNMFQSWFFVLSFHSIKEKFDVAFLAGVLKGAKELGVSKIPL